MSPLTGAFFVTGIGTGVGKTLVSAALLHQAPHYRAVKPIVSGFDEGVPEASDSGVLLGAMRQPVTSEACNAISPWRFAAPLSPHLAAMEENRMIDPEALLAWCQHRIQEHPNLLIEGVGGIMVPITSDWLVLDWMKALQLPVILVSASYLGAINHTLLSLQALKMAELRVHAVVVSQSAPECDAGLQQTMDSIAPFLPEGAQLLSVPRLAGTDSPWKKAPELVSLLND